MTIKTLLEDKQSSRPGTPSEIISQLTTNWLQKLSFGLIAAGIVLRLLQFFSARSLWADEAKLALNIINRSYLELTQVLDYNQVAPIGFLWVEKFFTQLFGPNEFALRLFPLLSGIASLVLIYHLAKRYLHPIAVPIAVAFLTFLSRQIYYSSEIKQYSSDVMIALLLVAVIHNNSNRLKAGQMALFSSVGAIAIWFSHPSVFVLAAIALSTILYRGFHTIQNRKPLQLSSWLIVYGVWAISFAGFYFLSLQANSSNDALLTSWADRRSFPASFPDLDWLFYSLKRFFWKPLDLPKPMIDMVAIATFLIGSVSLYKRRKQSLCVLTLPLTMTIIAAYLHKYPFYSRVVTFLVPFFVLIIAEGLATLIRLKTPKLHFLGKGIAVVGLVCTGLLLYVPVAEARAYLKPPVTDEEIKPLLQYVTEHQQPSDVLYVFQKSQFQFEFYRHQFGFQEDDYVIGVDPDEYVEENFAQAKRQLRADLNQLCGHQRVWILISDIDIRDQTIFILNYLDKLGQHIDDFKATTPASFVKLYNLSECSK